MAHRSSSHWKPAFHIVGNDLLECEQEPGLYLVGDHNIVGLEDGYLPGVYTANRVIKGIALNEATNSRIADSSPRFSASSLTRV